MKKPVNELDLDFDNVISDLYVVYDTTTNLDVSDVVTARNDALAVEAFKKFLEDSQQRKNKFSHFVIRNIGMYSHKEHRLTCGAEYDILSDDEDIEAYSQEIYDFLNKDEE